MNYFYARVSTQQQNVDRQLIAANEIGIPKNRIYIDKESGKNFERKSWLRLMKRLKKNDVLFVKSLDRMGRNYKEILRVWQDLTKDREIDVVVLDMPILDTRRDKNLLGTFIADLVLQVLSFVAENERANILERQRQGIEAAMARGVKFGRRRNALPDNFDEIAKKYVNGEILVVDAAKTTGMAMSTFRQRACEKFGPKQRKFVHETSTMPKFFKDEKLFDAAANGWLAGENTQRYYAQQLGINVQTFQKYVNRRFPGHERINVRRKGPRFDIHDERFVKFAQYWIDGKTTARIAAFQFGINDRTFVSYVRQLFPGTRCSNKNRIIKPNPANFKEIVDDWVNDNLSGRHAAKLSGLSYQTFVKRAQEYM